MRRIFLIRLRCISNFPTEIFLPVYILVTMRRYKVHFDMLSSRSDLPARETASRWSDKRRRTVETARRLKLRTAEVGRKLGKVGSFRAWLTARSCIRASVNSANTWHGYLPSSETAVRRIFRGWPRVRLLRVIFPRARALLYKGGRLLGKETCVVY